MAERATAQSAIYALRPSGSIRARRSEGHARSTQSIVSFGGNLPSVNVMDFIVHPRDRVLAAATHGRGNYHFIFTRTSSNQCVTMVIDSIGLFEPRRNTIRNL